MVFFPGGILYCLDFNSIQYTYFVFYKAVSRPPVIRYLDDNAKFDVQEKIM